MSNRFASGKHAIAECDRCGFRYKLSELKRERIKNLVRNVLVCRTCWDKDHPQLQLGLYPIEDPQAVRNPRPDRSYPQSRNTQWGWNPVGGAITFTEDLSPNDLHLVLELGTVTVS